MKGLYFLLGVGVGAAGTYLFLNKRMEARLEEEVQSVKDAYGKALDELKGNKDDDLVIVTGENEKNEKVAVLTTVSGSGKPPIKEYFKKIENGGYKDYSTKVNTKDPIHKPFSSEAEIITPDEYGEIEDYEKESLTLYEDGVLAYEIDDEEFEDADEKLPPDYADHIGEYEENVVYVRNDIEKTDYAIYRDNRTYEEVSGNKPHSGKG